MPNKTRKHHSSTKNKAVKPDMTGSANKDVAVISEIREKVAQRVKLWSRYDNVFQTNAPSAF